LSPDGGRVAFEDSLGKKSWLVVDGKAGPECDTCSGIGLTFSPDGTRLAYVTGKGDRRHSSLWVVVDGKAGAEYDEVLHLAFSPDSKRVAYAAKTDKQWAVVVDGHPGAAYDDILGPIFSPDGKRVAYGARQGKQWSVVADGQAGVAYDELFNFWHGPRNSQADLIEAQWMTMDSQSEVAYDELSTQMWGAVGYQYATRLVFSPDSKHLAYAAKRSGKWVVVVDGQEGAEYHDIGVGSPAFSPDGKRIAYSARTGNFAPWVVVVDGQAGPGFDAIFNPSFSSDGKHVAYVAMERLEKWTLVVDGQAGTEHWAIGSWTFSPDGKHLAYAAQVGKSRDPDLPGGLPNPYNPGKWAVVFDGQTGAEYSVILPGTLFFGSDGALEFLAVQGEDHSMVGDHHGSLYRVKYTPTQ
jgi:WD40 repeat protein